MASSSIDDEKISAIATTALQSPHHWLRKYRRKLQEQCVRHSLCNTCCAQEDDTHDDDDDLTSALKAYVRKMDMNVVEGNKIDYSPQIDFVTTTAGIAHEPKIDSHLSAGIDLYPAAHSDITISPHSSREVNTGLRCYIPEGYFGDIRPRSGLAKCGSIMVLAGVVDPSFRGEIKVWLFNPTPQPFTIKAGTAVAQMVLTRYCANVTVVVDGKRNPKPKARTHHEGGMGYKI